MDEHPATAVRVEEGLVDRRRLPARQGGQGRRVLLGGLAPVPRWRPRRSSWAASRACSVRPSRRCCPTAGRPCVLLDVGANADCKPEHLLQFAQMGAAYATIVLGVVAPAGRAAQHRRGADEGLAARAGGARADGRARPRLHRQRRGPRRPRRRGRRHRDRRLHRQRRAQAARGHEQDPPRPGQGRDDLVAPSTRRPPRSSSRRCAGCKDRLDPDTYGGAPLLGVDGVCIIGHGSSKATAVANAHPRRRSGRSRRPHGSRSPSAIAARLDCSVLLLRDVSCTLPRHTRDRRHHDTREETSRSHDTLRTDRRHRLVPARDGS